MPPRSASLFFRNRRHARYVGDMGTAARVCVVRAAFPVSNCCPTFLSPAASICGFSVVSLICLLQSYPGVCDGEKDVGDKVAYNQQERPHRKGPHRDKEV